VLARPVIEDHDHRVLSDADLEEFLRDGYRRVVGAVALVSGSLASAEDAVQEALVRAVERSKGPNDIESLEPWVVAVALNLSRSWLRRLLVERRARPQLVLPAAAPPGADAVDVRRALATLPRRQREAVVLRYFLDLDVREVASVMGIGEGTAKSALSRARSALAAELGERPEVTRDAGR
jgi:RNA polymerase sigma-70 factor (ECF subfamily)